MTEATRTKPPSPARRALAKSLLLEYAQQDLRNLRETLRQGVSLSRADQYRLLRVAEQLAALAL